VSGRRPLCLILCLLSSTVGAAGTPNDGGDEVEAAARFEAGRKAFDLGEYDAAVEGFLAADRLKHHPDILINIATCFERIYQPTKAREYYERFLAEKPADGPLHALAEKRLKVLRELPGSILVAANKPGASVVLTGEALRRTGATPQRFDALPPGGYHIRVSLADHGIFEQDVTLQPGESHVVDAHLEHQVETLTVYSVPDQARVFLDDREVGVTPFSRPADVGPGRKLRLEVPNLPPYAERFELKAGQPLTRRIAFKRPPRSGRSELLLASMIYGGGAASAVTLAIAGNRNLTIGVGLAIFIPTAVAGVGLGFLTAWSLSDDYLKVGHSSMIIGSTIWGGALGISLALGLDLSLRNSLAVSLLGSGLGMGAGIVTAWLADPSAGDAAIINSGAMWGTVTGALLTEALALSPASHDQVLGWLTLGGTSLGLVAGGLFARWFEVSREHVAIIDAAGALGLALGYGVGYASGNDNSGNLICRNGSCIGGARYALGGMAIGILAASILTRHYKGDLPLQEALVEPGRRGVSLGIPELHFAVAAAPEGPDRRLTIDLLRGTF
jgi:hypothetical protein